MKNLACLAVLCFVLSQAMGQHTLSGKVIDAKTNSPLMGVHVFVKGKQEGTVTDAAGLFKINLYNEETTVQFIYPDYRTQDFLLSKDTSIVVHLEMLDHLIDTVLTFDPESYEEQVQIVRSDRNAAAYNNLPINRINHNTFSFQNSNTEDYSPIFENIEKSALASPVSTFSIDVDQAAYSNVRRFINQNQKPPIDAVRIEEMINYFNYDYPQPKGKTPFSINTELAECPWNPRRKLLHIGLQGKLEEAEKLPSSNLVFLLDVSGSMKSPNKLGLVKSAFKLLIKQLRPEDKVAIAVYAGAAGLVLPATPGSDKEAILAALEKLHAGGSTAGGAGIQLAYQVAAENFLPNGNNRVILATDGDFNVGFSSDGALTHLIEEKRQSGIFLSVMGFGMGNYKDNKLELLADKGNGNYAYIDNLLEAKKVFVDDLLGTLFTIAKDVKIQLEFNPFFVKSYRLVGYENRLLNQEDFNNDEKDAGELGAGHTVTALYELEMVHTESATVGNPVAALRYQQTGLTKKARKSGEIANVKLRFKLPKENSSQLISLPILNKPNATKKTSDNFRFSAAVAGFGLILRKSDYNKTLDLETVRTLALQAKGKDEYGYRAEFIRLVELAGLQ